MGKTNSVQEPSRNKPQTQTSTIEVRTLDEKISRIEAHKKKAHENLKQYCIDRSIELMFGVRIDDNEMFLVDVEETLEILKFISSLN